MRLKTQPAVEPATRASTKSTLQSMARCLAALILGLGLVALLSVFFSPVAQAQPLSALAPDAAAVIFTKTVSTDPAVCATTHAITLPIGGGPAYYCYTIRNAGTVSLTRHTLVDDHLGTLLFDFPFPLAPGASAFITEAAVITVTTINSATWTAYNPGPIDVASDSDSATVNVIPALPAIALAKTVGTDPAICAATEAITLTATGGSVTYCYAVKNTGNLTLTRHTLVDDHLGTLLFDFPFPLAPGASAFITEAAVITATTINTATWTAYNPGPVNSVTVRDTARVVVLRRSYLPLIVRE